MRATRVLYDLGQSLWLDNITRDLLTSGTLKKYIDTLSVTGLTSNPTIFDHAISRSNAYDSEIRRLVGRGLSGETLFFELAIQDLTQAADMFAPIHERTDGVDGWVSLEVSPLLAYDSQKSSDEAKALHAKANCRNLFIKIPGTREGLPAIEAGRGERFVAEGAGLYLDYSKYRITEETLRRRTLTSGPQEARTLRPQHMPPQLSHRSKIYAVRSETFDARNALRSFSRADAWSV